MIPGKRKEMVIGPVRNSWFRIGHSRCFHIQWIIGDGTPVPVFTALLQDFRELVKYDRVEIYPK